MNLPLRRSSCECVCSSLNTLTLTTGQNLLHHEKDPEMFQELISEAVSSLHMQQRCSTHDCGSSTLISVKTLDIAQHQLTVLSVIAVFFFINLFTRFLVLVCCRSAEFFRPRCSAVCMTLLLLSSDLSGLWIGSMKLCRRPHES